MHRGVDFEGVERDCIQEWHFCGARDGMATHDLKTVNPWFSHLYDGSKEFEVRLDDRGYAVGDELLLREWSESIMGGVAMGRWMRAQVRFVLRGRDEHLPFRIEALSPALAVADERELVIMGIRVLERSGDMKKRESN